jgi:hypothetical protein
MIRRRIDDVIRRKLGTFCDAGIPEPSPGRKWQRFDCPFCGKSRAAINYNAGYFVCYHADCQVQLSAEGEPSVVARFRPQIRQAVYAIRTLYDSWRFGWQEVYNFAAERVCIYAGKPDDHDADAGKLDDWEIDVKGDPNQLDRYVLHALNRDLADWARAEVRRRARQNAMQFDDGKYSTDLLISKPGRVAAEKAQHKYDSARYEAAASVPEAKRRTAIHFEQEPYEPARPGATALSVAREGSSETLSATDTDAGWAGVKAPAKTVKDAEPSGDLSAYPVLAMKYRDRMTQMQIAKALGVNVKAARQQMRQELEHYKKDHGITL